MLIHTPHRNKAEGTRRTIELVEASALAPGTVLIDHNNELTVHDVLASELLGGLLDLSGDEDGRAPDGADHRRARPRADHRQLSLRLGRVGSAQGPQDRRAMRAAGYDDDTIDRVVWRNPVEFFGQSGHLMLDELEEREPTATFEGSGVLPGERE